MHDKYGSTRPPSFSRLRRKLARRCLERRPFFSISATLSQSACTCARPRSLHRYSSSPGAPPATILPSRILSILLSSSSAGSTFFASPSAASADALPWLLSFFSLGPLGPLATRPPSSGASRLIASSLSLHVLWRLFSPPNLGLSRQLMHVPQSSRALISCWAERAASLLPAGRLVAEAQLGQNQSPSGTEASGGVRHCVWNAFGHASQRSSSLPSIHDSTPHTSHVSPLSSSLSSSLSINKSSSSFST